MSNEHDKAVAELAVFANFVRIAALPIAVATVEKRAPPEPDLLCTHSTDGKLAFELVEICDSNLARALSNPRPNAGGVQYLRTSDPSWDIVRKKLSRVYETDLPIELLCYTAGRVITPSDVILPTITPLLRSFRHTFRRAWLFSKDQVFKVWD